MQRTELAAIDMIVEAVMRYHNDVAEENDFIEEDNE